MQYTYYRKSFLLVVLMGSPGFLCGSVSQSTFGVRQIVYPIGQTSPTPLGTDGTGGEITAPGYYALSQGVTGGIIVKSNGVTLNLNGYRVYPNLSDGAAGILVATGAHDIAISNGIIGPDASANTYGVYLPGDNSNISIERCLVNNNSYGFLLQGTQQSNINTCAANNNSIAGYNLDGCSLVTVADSSAQNTNNTVGNAYGFRLDNGSKNVLEHCTAQDTNSGASGYTAAGFSIGNNELSSVVRYCLAQGTYAGTGAQANGIDFPIMQFYPMVGPSGDFGVTVNSISWCCDGTGSKLLAIGGQNSNQPTGYIHVYKVNNDGTSFTAINDPDTTTPTDLGTAVNAVAWCCDGSGNKFLAAGGSGSAHATARRNGSSPAGYLHVYQLNSDGISFTQLSDPDTTTLGAAVNAVAWCCDGNGNRFLAACGYSVGESNMGYLNAYQLGSSGSFSPIMINPTSGFGQSANAVAWCCDGSGNRFLAVCGSYLNPTSIGYVNAFQLSSDLTQLTQISNPDPSPSTFGESANTVAWCCDGNNNRVLAVGGSNAGAPQSGYVHAFTLSQDITTNPATWNFASIDDPGTPAAFGNGVNAIAWCCNGTGNNFLVIGVQYTSDPAASGILVYELNANKLGFVPIQALQGSFGQSAVPDWCCDGGCSRLLAVGGSNSDYTVGYVTAFEVPCNNLIIQANTVTNSANSPTGGAYGMYGNDCGNLVISNIAYENDIAYGQQIIRTTTDYTSSSPLYNFAAQ